jgi:hypothetical protein
MPFNIVVDIFYGNQQQGNCRFYPAEELIRSIYRVLFIERIFFVVVIFW